MAKLLGWECDKCFKQDRKELFPKHWVKATVQFENIDEPAREYIWCHICWREITNPPSNFHEPKDPNLK